MIVVILQVLRTANENTHWSQVPQVAWQALANGDPAAHTLGITEHLKRFMPYSMEVVCHLSRAT